MVRPSHPHDDAKRTAVGRSGGGENAEGGGAEAAAAMSRHFADCTFKG